MRALFQSSRLSLLLQCPAVRVEGQAPKSRQSPSSGAHTDYHTMALSMAAPATPHTFVDSDYDYELSSPNLSVATARPVVQ